MPSIQKMLEAYEKHPIKEIADLAKAVLKKCIVRAIIMEGSILQYMELCASPWQSSWRSSAGRPDGWQASCV